MASDKQRPFAMKGMARAFHKVMGDTTPSIKERDGSDPRERSTPEQYAVIRCLARGDKPEVASAKTLVHPERIRRWLGISWFARAILVERLQPGVQLAFPHTDGLSNEEEQ